MIGELRHVTLGLEYLTAAMRGERYDWATQEAAADAKPMTRESVVRDMEAAIAESYPLVDAKASPGVLLMLEHQAEHYGKLVSAYRAAGIVPPTSRPQR